MPKNSRPESDEEFSDWVNSVQLVGRVTSEAEEIVLPSDQILVRFRLVVPRENPTTRTTVDTVDCVAFKSVIQRKIRSLKVGDIVDLDGQFRRRFWKAGSGVASRVEVEVSTLKRLK